MNKEREFGTVEAGKRADLLLLNSNPLHSVGNLRDKAGVMIRGIWLSEEEIDRIAKAIQATFNGNGK
jgi:imidazolonepropionase-like amidohydrolase